jgi:hypothetical protein
MTFDACHEMEAHMSVSITFNIAQTAGSIERVDLHRDGDTRVTSLIFNGNAPLTLNLTPGHYVVVATLIGGDGDTMKVTWDSANGNGTLLDFAIAAGALGTRELPGGKWLGVGFYADDLL